jgi:hypothetical protein
MWLAAMSTGALILLFNIEFDHGDMIEGYLIPDGFSEQARIKVIGAEGELATLPCSVVKEAVLHSGRHESGLVGFRLDENVIPDIRSQDRLAIYDDKTGLLVYRRPPPDRANFKLLRLEMQLLPMNKLDQVCSSRFQYNLASAERFGHETVLQAFHLHAVESIYISGRLLLRNYEEFLDKGFQVVAVLPDPYYEMATRIFILKRLLNTNISFIGDRDRLILSPAADYFKDINLDDESALKKALKKAPPKVRNVLTSPFVRQLVCTYPEQAITRRDVAPAIDILSRFTIVGHSDNSRHFQSALGELLSISPDDLPVLPYHQMLIEIADKLRNLTIAELMLEEDLIFAHYVRKALD